MEDPWRVFLLLFVDDDVMCVFDDFGFKCFRRGHYFGYTYEYHTLDLRARDFIGVEMFLRTIPLSSDLVPPIAIAPWIIVDSVLGIHPHVFVVRALAI